MSGNLVIDTSVYSGAGSAPAISQQLTATYAAGQTINQLVVIKPGQQFASTVGFSTLALTTSAPVQLIASLGSNPTFINQTVNQQTTVDETVDTFNVVNNSATLTVSVRLVYVVYTGATPPQPTIVTSVNGLTGAVVLTASNITGFATVATSGSYNDLLNKPAAYVLPVATASVLGGVKQGTGVSIAGDGTISVTAIGGVSSVSGQTGAVVVSTVDNNDASGISLISDSGATTGTAKLKTLVQGTGITIAADANGNLEISGANQYVLPVATATVLGGVKQGTNITIGSDGTISATAAPYTLPPATTNALGGVIVQAGLTVDDLGNLSANVLSFNGRVGAIAFELMDVLNVGGAPLASPTFNGNPTAPTPVTGNNSTSIATTAFVTAAVAAGSSGAISVFEFIATAGQTVFPATFPAGAVVEVFHNGGLLLSTDYGTNGGVGPVTFNTGANLNDEVKILATTPFNVANTVLATGGSFTGVVQGITAAPGDNSTQFATTAFVDAAISNLPAAVSSFNTRTGAVTLQLSDVTGVGGAPLASPTFTGVPAAPTATAGTNTTQIATTAFVQAAVTASVGVASFNTRTGAVTLQLSDVTGVGGAPLASPTFTGVPAAPTATAGTNTTQLATTAFVTSAISAIGTGVTTFNTRSGAVTLQLSDVTGVGGAPLASPTFTGVPAAPTATAGTNTTQLATTAFVTAAVAASVGVSSFNTRTGAVTLQLSDVTGVGGAPLASPTFTGTVTLPSTTVLPSGVSATEQGYLDNSTLIATDSFVKRSILAATAAIPLTGITGGTYNFASIGTGASFAVLTSGGAISEVLAIAAAGASYQVGDCLIMVGGNGDAIVLVTAVSSGGVSTATVLYGGTGYSGSPQLSGSALPPGSRTGELSGTLTSNATIIIPAGNYLQGARRISFDNNTTGAFTVTVKLSNGSGGSTGTGVVLPQGTNNSTSMLLYTDGVNDVWPEVGVVPGYAPLASPTFTGVPAAPTATAGTNTTQLATTAFVTAAVAAGTAGVSSFNTRTGAVTLQASDVTGVGGALLASPTFTGVPAAPTATAGTSTTQIATTAFVATSYAPLASPTFTGVPAAPTAAAGVNTTQVATTAFVYNATQATGSVALTNANVTLSAAQYGNALITFTGALTANVVITFPTSGQWTLFNSTTGAFTVTVSNGSGATFAVPQTTTMEVISSGTTGMQASSTSSPVRFQSPTYSYLVSALGSVSGTQTLNLAAATEFTMTITGATTIAFTNTLGTNIAEVVYIRFTNAGSAAITWPASTKFANLTAPTFTTSGVDMVGVKYDVATSTYMVFVVGLNIG
jgi:hypothetical protein